MTTKQIYISILTACVPFLISVVIMPFIKKIAEHIGAMDIPDSRKVHSEPKARLGGLGIFFSFLIGLMLFVDISNFSTLVNRRIMSILVGSIIVVITGMCDDIKPLKAKEKLLFQILSACIVVFYGNLLLDKLTVFGYTINFSYFAYPLTIFFIVACENIINLIDGLDGLAGGISSIFFASVVTICLFANRVFGFEFIFSLIMLGATLGFLVHNFYPSKIFMGDSGSLFLGFTISIISLLGFKTTVVTSIMIPIAIIAVPILDTLFAIIRRLLKHQKIFDPDKEHLHHQLLKLNFSHRNTVLIIYGIDILFATASILYSLNDTKDIFIGRIIYGILFIMTIIFVFKTNIIKERKK